MSLGLVHGTGRAGGVRKDPGPLGCAQPLTVLTSGPALSAWHPPPSCHGRPWIPNHFLYDARTVFLPFSKAMFAFPQVLFLPSLLISRIVSILPRHHGVNVLPLFPRSRWHLCVGSGGLLLPDSKLTPPSTSLGAVDHIFPPEFMASLLFGHPLPACSPVPAAAC